MRSHRSLGVQEPLETPLKTFTWMEATKLPGRPLARMARGLRCQLDQAAIVNPASRCLMQHRSLPSMQCIDGKHRRKVHRTAPGAAVRGKAALQLISWSPASFP